MKRHDKRHDSSGQSETSSVNGTNRSGEAGELPPDWYKAISPAQNPSGEEPRSEVFRRFAAPIYARCKGFQQIQSGYRLAFMAWNLAMLPHHVRLSALADTLRNFPEESRMELKVEIASLVERKEKLFRDHAWVIQRMHIEQQGSGETLYLATVDVNSASENPPSPIAEDESAQ